MEAFSLLRYWRSNGGDATTNADVRTSTATTIVTAVSSQTSETVDEEGDVVSEDNDNGPFFDLEFSLPAEEVEGEGGEGEGDGEDEYLKNGVDYRDEDEEEESDGSDEVEDESELKFTLVSGSSGDSTADVNVSVSPSDDLFFKGGFVNVDHTAEIDSKPMQTRVSLMKSATKIRVMMLKFKKSKSKSNGESTESSDSNSNAHNVTNSKEEQKKNENQNVGSEDSGKSMAVKCKVEGVPIVSLFRRHNSSKSPKKPQNEDESVSASSEEKKFSKEAMQKYLRKVKPLYVRVSKRYGEKLKLTGQLSLPRVTITKPNPAPSPANEEHKQSPAANPRGEKESTSEVSEPPLLQSNNIKALKQGNLPAGLRVVCKHLRKSRSASTAVVAAAPGAISSQRRDDSLLQQQDGIQSAILHCKRSFKASRDVDCSSSSSSGETAPPCAADEKETEEINKRNEDEMNSESSRDGPQ